jgi:hypothetical protein
MTMLETVFFFGLILGLLLGLWIGGRLILSRLHHDDVEEAHTKYRKRKEKYL